MLSLALRSAPRYILRTATMSTYAPSHPLGQTKCEPCTSSLPSLPSSEISQLLQSLEAGWSLSPQPQTTTSPKPDALKRSYRFKNFVTAQAFANEIGKVAEEEGHHPAIMVEWGRVSVWWWSHSIKGLHRNDFVMAAKTDELVRIAEGYRPPKLKAT